MTDPLPDLEARRMAATEFDRNLVVEAGAGTGKTSLLVERALNVLLTGRARPRQLAAITFTEKAAGEMLARLARALDRILLRLERPPGAGEGPALDGSSEAGRVLAGPAGREEAAALRQRALDALSHLDRMTVTTIHGFCADLLRLHPREAGVSPEFTVDTGERFLRMFEERWEAFLEAELGPSADRAGAWEEALADFRPAEMKEVARALAGFKVPEEMLDDPGAAPGADEVLAPLAGRLAAGARALLQEEAADLTPTQARVLEWWAGALEAFAGGGLRAMQLWLARREDAAKRLEKNSGAPASRKHSPGLAARLKDLDGRCRALLRDLQVVDDAMTGRLIGLLAPFARDFREAFLAAGLVSYDGLLALARDLLRRHPDVRRSIKRRYRTLLVDEFQDTDPLQYDIVLMLAERIEDAADDPWQARLQPGRLFIVGDPKQSIYRFRGADYGAFSRAVTRVQEQGGTLCRLTANFRSLPDVLEPVNRLFEGEGWQPSDVQPRYVAVTSPRERVREPRVEIWAVPGNGGEGPPRAGDRRRAEGEAIAARLARLIRERQIEARQATILLRAFTNLADYVRPLRRHGVEFLVDGGREFMDRSEIQHLMAVLRALARPHDPIACVAFMRSPSGAVPDPDLARHATADGAWSWQEIAEAPASASPAMVAAARRLRDLAARVSGLPADAAVSAVLRHSPVAVLESTTFEGAQRVANLRKLAAAAASQARDGELGLAEVLDLIEQVRPQELEGEAPLADEATDAVRIMTIHKAKGLENDLVIVPDLAREAQARAPHGATAESIDLEDGRALALEIGRHRNAARILQRLTEPLHERAEEARVLYVALTRARERLAVVASVGRTPTPWIRSLTRWDYDPSSPPSDGALLSGGQVIHHILQPAPAAAARKARETAGLENAAAAWNEAAALARRGQAPAFATPSGVAEERGERLEEDAAPTAARGEAAAAEGRAVGIALHLLLERWRGDAAGLQAALPRCAARAAAETGLPVKQVEAAAAEVVQAFAASPLSARHAEMEILGREVPVLLTAGDGRLWRGSIDLLARRGDGTLVVIDYKTDREDDDAVLAARHTDQLAVYAESVRRAFGLATLPAAELWLLRSGQVVNLDVASAAARLMLAPAGG